MVRIRLRRVGSRHQPSYRLVAAEKESPRDGRFLEILGHYNPRTEPATIVLEEERIYHWLKNGAQPSDSVRQILNTAGAWQRWERFKQGEDISVLLEEAVSEKVEVDPRTRRDDLLEGKKSKKKATAEAEAEAAPEPAVKEEPAAETVDEEPAEAEGADAVEEAAAEAEGADAVEEAAAEAEGADAVEEAAAEAEGADAVQEAAAEAEGADVVEEAAAEEAAEEKADKA
jgi:small subunit ribosomal protein S16